MRSFSAMAGGYAQAKRWLDRCPPRLSTRMLSLRPLCIRASAGPYKSATNRKRAVALCPALIEINRKEVSVMTGWKPIATLLFIIFAFTASGCFYWHDRHYDRGRHYGHHAYEYHDRNSGDHYWNYGDNNSRGWENHSHGN
jgi:hypothetical protein